MQLTTFAFPPDPLPFALVPAAATMEKEKSLAPVWRGPVTPVQLRDAFNRRSQQFVVFRYGFLRRIRPVGKQGETKIAFGIRQVMHFQPFDLLANLGLPGQESRDDDEGAQF